MPADLPSSGGTGGTGGSGDRGPLLLGGLILAVVAVVGAMVWWVASGRGPSVALGGNDDEPTPEESFTFSPRPEPSESPTTPPIEPKVKGWQPVVHAERGLAYDVPEDWDVNSAGTIIGFENKNGPLVAMRGSADYQRGFCPGESGSSLGGAGVAKRAEGDLARAARDRASEWASAGYTDEERGVVPDIMVGTPEPVRIKGAKAYHAKALVEVDSPGRCDASSALVHVVAARGGGADGVFVLYADRGMPDSLTENTIDKIVGSVRVYRP
ncbi:MAG: hypothetical protein GEV11_16160 [Streptosporangiales bacterium]|nr:hypothetical protein [Streptosporangiales bacterium]